MNYVKWILAAVQHGKWINALAAAAAHSLAFHCAMSPMLLSREWGGHILNKKKNHHHHHPMNEQLRSFWNTAGAIVLVYIQLYISVKCIYTTYRQKFHFCICLGARAFTPYIYINVYKGCTANRHRCRYMNVYNARSKYLNVRTSETIMVSCCCCRRFCCGMCVWQHQHQNQLRCDVYKQMDVRWRRRDADGAKHFRL